MRVIVLVVMLLFVALAGVLLCDVPAEGPEFDPAVSFVESIDFETGTAERVCTCWTCITRGKRAAVNLREAESLHYYSDHVTNQNQASARVICPITEALADAMNLARFSTGRFAGDLA